MSSDIQVPELAWAEEGEDAGHVRVAVPVVAVRLHEVSGDALPRHLVRFRIGRVLGGKEGQVVDEHVTEILLSTRVVIAAGNETS